MPQMYEETARQAGRAAGAAVGAAAGLVGGWYARLRKMLGYDQQREAVEPDKQPGYEDQAKALEPAAPAGRTTAPAEAPTKEKPEAKPTVEQAPEPEKLPGMGTGTVTASALNVRDAPDARSGAKVGMLNRGETVDVLAKNGAWLVIRFEGGEAYVHGGYVDLSAAPVIEEEGPSETTTEPSGGSGGEAEAPVAVTGDLATLMAKDRLTPTEIATVRELIAKEPDDKQGALFEQLQSKVAYHSQRDNESKTDGANINNMCNLTTLAACLEYLGIRNPGSLDGKDYPQFEDYLEAVRVKNKYGPRTTGAAMEKLVKHMGAKGFTWVIGGTKNTKKDEWFAWRDKYIRGGYALLLSIGGHIVRVQGVKDGGLVVDDPYGQITLKPAKDTKSNHWSYGSGRNAANVADNKGEDNVWAWSDVEGHAMKWMVGIS